MTDGGPNPALRDVLSLPACAGGSDHLGAWTSSALAPYVEVPLSPAIPVPHSDSIRDVPILRDLGPPTCVAAGKMGTAVGWEARDPSTASSKVTDSKPSSTTASSFDEAWLRSKLEAIGAQASSADDHHTGGPPFLSVTFTVDGRQLVGVFGAQAPLPLPLGNVTGVVTEGEVDLYVIEDHQAYGYCGNIFLNVRDPLAGRPSAPDEHGATSAVAVARALVRKMSR